MSSLRVFINYRREDSAGHSGRLYDALAERFGRDQIFMDIDTMQPGVDFTKVVDQSVGGCDVLIAVIGRQWAGVTDARGVRRLDKPEDWVRIELERALERGEVQVVPTLVEGADMPSTDELPEPLRPLAFRNAIELSDSRWRYDVGRLIQALERLEEEKNAREAGEQAPRAEAERNAVEPAPASDEAAPERPPIGRSHRGGETETAPVGATGAPPGYSRRVRRLAVAAAGLIVAAAVAVAVVVAGRSEDPSPGGPSQQKVGGAAGGSTQRLQDRGCDAADSMRSRSSTESTAINFENKTADAVRIYWMNFRGERERFASLGPGKTLRQQTYTTHPWLVTDAAGDCLGLYLPAAEPGHALVPATGASSQQTSAGTLPNRGCDAADSMRSRSSTESTAINFENKTADAVRIYWMNFRGERERFASLGPGKILRQQTYITHPWLVTDAAGDCLGLYLPAPEPARAVMSGP